MMLQRFVRICLLTVAALAMPVLAQAQFDTPNRSFHNATAFRLDGRHQTVPCEACHLNGQLRGTPNTCFDCHWVRRKDDRYQTRLGTRCETCHRPSAWIDVRWNHATQSGIPLNADHRQVACVSCHAGGNFRSASVTCVSCHQKDFSATKAPNHLAAGFPPTCDSCHRPSESTWRNTGTGAFSHNAVFPLVGTHTTLACATCHKNNVFKGTARDCVGCHQADYNRAQNPNHVAAGFPLSCDACHRATDPSFKGAGAATSFNHNSIFQLVGQHGTVNCTACHKNNVFKGTPRDCVGCHQENYNRTQNPNHAGAGFSTTCETCHRPSDPSWSTGGFNHNSVFALVGTHATQTCATCHRNGVFKGTARECVGCHIDKYNRTQNPNHVAAGFPTSCETCHRPTDPQWAGANFNHASVFALVGTHASTSCASCHKNNTYKGTPRDCVGCHIDKYNATRNPPHAAAGFSTACESCHRPTDARWTGVTFNHSAVFALVGTHATAACATCHKNGVYKGTPRDCVGCHLDKYNATKSPPHAAAGFSTSCETCHRPTDTVWTQGSFNHNTAFALVGNHATAACSRCHVNGVYRGTPRTCVGCHLDKYNGTTNPNHASAGFGTTCETCHKPVDANWQQGKFTHTRFPLTGRHNVACAQCHTTPNNYQTFSCLVCHTRSETDSEHRGRAGYVYESNACYSCHPNGRS